MPSNTANAQQTEQAEARDGAQARVGDEQRRKHLEGHASGQVDNEPCLKVSTPHPVAVLFIRPVVQRMRDVKVQDDVDCECNVDDDHQHGQLVRLSTNRRHEGHLERHDNDRDGDERQNKQVESELAARIGYDEERRCFFDVANGVVHARVTGLIPARRTRRPPISSPLVAAPRPQALAAVGLPVGA